MAPYLLFGFLIAGLLSVLISSRTVERSLGGRGLMPSVKAALFGIPLPLCSCGVIPVAASLRRSGASPGAATSFLISTPQTGVDSIMVTFSLLGPVYAVFRPLAALVTGLIGGGLVEFLGRNKNGGGDFADDCKGECYVKSENGSKLLRALKYGFITLPQDIGKPILLGLLLAGLIAAVLPQDFFASYLGSGIIGMLVMMAVGIPIYVCATASVPLAAALIAAGISPGAALVFLMTGPATNAAALTTIWKVLGRRTALIYLGTVAAGSLLAGLTLDYIFTLEGMKTAVKAPYMMPNIIRDLSAILLLFTLGYALFKNYKGKVIGDRITEGEMATTEIKIKGMSCSHCAETVQKALSDCPGVESVRVDLKGSAAMVAGEGYQLECLRQAVEKSGYTIVK